MSRQKSVSDLGENALVTQLTRGLTQRADVLVGPGDDCAVLRSAHPAKVLLLKTDCVVEGVHFRAGTPPSAIGRKALNRALSDIAAMAGTPTAALVTVGVERSRPAAVLRALYRGLESAARRHGVSIVGGETTSTGTRPALIVSVALLGEAPAGRFVLRSGARPGDRIVVTGRLGGAMPTRHLRFDPRLEEARWLARTAAPTAMMDLSDGLAQDLPRLARASGVSFSLDENAIPRRRGCTLDQAVGDGEDYELLLTVPARRLTPSLLARWKKCFPRLPLTAIGTVTSARHGQGFPPMISQKRTARFGWEHFRSP